MVLFVFAAYLLMGIMLLSWFIVDDEAGFSFLCADALKDTKGNRVAAAVLMTVVLVVFIFVWPLSLFGNDDV